MSGRALRLDDRSFRFLIVGTGLCWSVAFPVIALFYQLELYGDGAMFSYAVAVRDVWAFHWHNISGRTSVFLLTLLPAEALVGITGSPSAGIIAYGLALLYFSIGGTGRDLRGRPLTRPHHLRLCVRIDSPALPADLRLSHGDVARPRDVLANAGAEPLCENNAYRGLAGVCRLAPAGLHARRSAGAAPGHRSNAGAARLVERSFRTRSNQPDDCCGTGRGGEDRPSARRLLRRRIFAGCTALLRSRNLPSERSSWYCWRRSSPTAQS